MATERAHDDDEIFEDDPVRTTGDLQEGVIPDADEPYSTERPDFARGQEDDPDRMTRFVEDKFSRGQETDPTLHQQVHEGDFAEGMGEEERHPELDLDGRFARGQQATDPDSPNRDDALEEE